MDQPSQTRSVTICTVTERAGVSTELVTGFECTAAAPGPPALAIITDRPTEGRDHAVQPEIPPTRLVIRGSCGCRWPGPTRET